MIPSMFPGMVTRYTFYPLGNPLPLLNALSVITCIRVCSIPVRFIAAPTGHLYVEVLYMCDDLLKVCLKCQFEFRYPTRFFGCPDCLALSGSWVYANDVERHVWEKYCTEE